MTDDRPQTADDRPDSFSKPVRSPGLRLMLAFEGYEPPAYVREWIAQRLVAGFTLFREPNVQNASQVRRLTGELQRAAAEAGHGPLLIASDQEGGQLLALGADTTPFPGNMALGATGDPELARQVGHAIGREMAAMGVNVNYAPVCDVNSNPQNPNVGVRAFGDHPRLVATLGAAMIQGMQEAGVAATAKHFPGNGESAIDPHYGVPSLPQTREELEDGAFKPFREAIGAGVKLIMTAHVALPRLTGREDVPATLQKEIMHDLLRGQDGLGFEGLLISDAMDMEAISQGAGQIVDAIAALLAGVDVLLLTPGRETQERLYQGLKLALSRKLISEENARHAMARVTNLQQWLAQQTQPPFDAVGCREHRALARTVAERSITLLRDEAGLLPFGEDRRKQPLVVVMPRPADLTPADTSSYVSPSLAGALRHYHPRVEEIITEHPPTDGDIAGLKQKLGSYDESDEPTLILVTLSASMQEAQATMARALLALELPTVTVAARTPYDLASYPQARTHLCTYGIQPPSMHALAAALFGQIPLSGRLPVTIPDLYALGHGLPL